MSIIYCPKCNRYIDTDFNAEHDEEEHGEDEKLETKLRLVKQ